MIRSDQASVRVLVVDDDRIILDSLSELLQFEGYEVVAAASLREAVDLLEEEPVDLILCDVNIPGGNGLELLHLAKRRFPAAVSIMMTGYGTIESAVESIKMGAYDYLTKPIVDDELTVCLERALAQQAILRENRTLKERLDERFGLDQIIGHDYRMLRVFDLIETVAATNVSVLIRGPSGTGKSMVARVLHHRGDRRGGPFVEVSCGAIPESLLESELFGYAKGAFTGAVARKEGKFKAAHGGTLFLDEIDAASPALQVKLLRVLQSREFEPVGSNDTETVDVRVLLATNADLEREVREGRFREDLYYRVNVVTIEMPSLAERIADVPILAKFFVTRHAEEMGRPIAGIDDEAVQVLQRYSWPGNVRELEHTIARAVVLCKGRRITLRDLPDKLLAQADEIESPESAAGLTLKEALEQPERRIIEAALRANGWSRQRTAAQLGINRTTLYKKMKQYGLEVEPIPRSA